MALINNSRIYEDTSWKEYTEILRELAEQGNDLNTINSRFRYNDKTVGNWLYLRKREHLQNSLDPQIENGLTALCINLELLTVTRRASWKE